MKNKFQTFVFALALLLGAALAVNADQGFLNQAEVWRAMAACSFEGKKAKTVSVTAATAATATAVGKGMVRLYCTQEAHFYQGAAGVTAPTAGTSDSPIGPKAPEYVRSPGNTYFAFIRDSADGTCYVTECK